MGTPLCVFLVVNTLKEHRWFFNMQLLIGHGQVPTIMPEASDLFKIKFNDIESVVSPILLTSDGIHDFLSADQLEDIIEEYGLTETACEEMISKARMLGSCDDASIVLGCLYRSDKAGDDS